MDYFGYSVAISGGAVFVSAPGYESTDSKIQNHGAIFVFTLAKGTYSVSATLMDLTPGTNDQFGFSTSGMPLFPHQHMLSTHDCLPRVGC
jgi:hypothetical protein